MVRLLDSVPLAMVIAASLMAAPSKAAACEPAPAWYEQDLDEILARHLADETQWWDEAQTVVLVRRVQRTSLQINGGEARRVRLEPVRVLKGADISGVFTLEHTEVTTCGPLPDWDALSPYQADEYVIYLRGARATQDAVLGTRGRREVRETRAREALERP